MAFGWDDAIAAGLQIIDKIIPDPNAKAAAQAQYQLAMLQAQADNVKGQLAANQAEATNPNQFVSGWRPAIGWVCCFALAYQYLGVPLGEWGLILAGHAQVAAPVLDSNLWQLMLGMLGLGGLRTYEKLQGVQGNH